VKIKNNTLHLIALSSSLICAVHCVAMPVLLSFSTLSSLHFWENPYIEWIFINFGLVFVFIPPWPSYYKLHHQEKPLRFAALGFLFMALSRLNAIQLWENQYGDRCFYSGSSTLSKLVINKDEKESSSLNYYLTFI